VTESADQSRLFVTVECTAADEVTSVLEELHAVEAYSLVREGETEHLLALMVNCPTLPGKLIRHGGRPRSIVATPDGLDVVVDLPVEADVRTYVEMLADQFGPVDLQSRRTVERELQTRQGHVSALLGSLTDRQLDVLRTAYFGGFFEWPRDSTGEEIADLLGVSQPTVNRHLRLGQRALLANLFDEDS
jgi:DNA-binding CsgD family transcriptional regulator